ncbi:MAG: Rieske (2Fe-2S) protein, partial [Pseudomonadota bacterium]|nr:Rieske (2Fe-2S) protein [Pseudomonadota bacterium]
MSEPDDLSRPVTIGVEAYTSVEYARAERDRLWRKVWQQVGRIEEIPAVGNYLAYEILEDSVIVVRTAADTIKAYHNVCPHRGRRLVDIPQGAKQGCGRKTAFTCGFHGWRFNLDGENTHIPHKDDWCGALTGENTHLSEVRVDAWGGWLWINMDPGC